MGLSTNGAVAKALAGADPLAEPVFARGYGDGSGRLHREGPPDAAEGEVRRRSMR